MVKFNVGDTVKVWDAGKCYTTYKEWAELHGLTNYANKAEVLPLVGNSCKVIAVDTHTEKRLSNRVLLGIEDSAGRQFIIEAKGVSFTDSKFKVGDKVWSIALGNGTVVEIASNSSYPVRVLWERGGVVAYTSEGKHLSTDVRPSLYAGHDLVCTITQPEYEWQWMYKCSVDGQYKTTPHSKSQPVLPPCTAFKRIEESKRLAERT